MKFEIFAKIVSKLESNHKRVSSIYSLGVNLVNISDDLHTVISHLFGEYYGKEGLDWIDWFLYEKDFGRREDITAKDAEGNETCRNIYELWTIVEEGRKDSQDYEIRDPLSDEDAEKLLKKFFNQ